MSLGLVVVSSSESLFDGMTNNIGPDQILILKQAHAKTAV